MCEIIGFEFGDDKKMCIFLRSTQWSDSYKELNDELTYAFSSIFQLAVFRRYSLLVSRLQSIDFVFNSDRLLYYNNDTSTFQRCFVIGDAGKDQINAMLVDAFKKVTVSIDSLYKMPVRFNNYHHMSFGLKIDKMLKSNEVRH